MARMLNDGRAKQKPRDQAEGGEEQGKSQDEQGGLPLAANPKQWSIRTLHHFSGGLSGRMLIDCAHSAELNSRVW